jgi:hypothetical protein
VPKPAPPLAPIVPKVLPSQEDSGNPDLPAIRIMPKRPEDIPNQFRASAVELNTGDK